MEKAELKDKEIALIEIPLETGLSVMFSLIRLNQRYNVGELEERDAVAQRIVRTYNTHDEMLSTLVALENGLANTPGCTVEAIGFTGILPELQKLDTVVIGVSPDSPESHAKFIEKKSLKVTLLSDIDRKVLKPYGKWGKKKFRGKEYIGVTRSTFLIDPSGKIAHIWPKVSVNGHPEEVQKVLMEVRKE